MSDWRNKGSELEAARAELFEALLLRVAAGNFTSTVEYFDDSERWTCNCCLAYASHYSKIKHAKRCFSSLTARALEDDANYAALLKESG